MFYRKPGGLNGHVGNLHLVDPADRTVIGLTREAGLSRTGFAPRFATLMLMPMGYLPARQIQIAGQELRDAG